MGILPMRINPATHGQDAHATPWFLRDIFLSNIPSFSMPSLSLFRPDSSDFLLSFSDSRLHDQSNSVSLPLKMTPKNLR